MCWGNGGIELVGLANQSPTWGPCHGREKAHAWYSLDFKREAGEPTDPGESQLVIIIINDSYIHR